MTALYRRYDHSATGLVRTNPAKVLAWLKKQGFEAAVSDYKHGIFRDGVEAKKHPLRRGWVAVQWRFTNSLRRVDKKTNEDWRRAADRVHAALQGGPFLVRYDGESGLIEVVEKAP